MRLLRFLDSLNESPMGTDQLLKPNSSTGEPRIDILIRKLNNNEPLETTDSRKILVTNKTQVISWLQNLKKHGRAFKEPIKFEGKFDDGSTGSIGPTKLLKTAEFGGGSSGRAGGKSTMDITEGGSAFCAAVAQILNRPMTEADWNLTNFKKAAPFVGASVKPEDVAANDNPTVRHSCIETGNIIRRHLEGGTFMYYQRGFGLTKLIYDVFKKCKTKQKISIRDDKWNPADVWAVYKQSIGTIQTRLQSLLADGFLEELNADIWQWAAEAEMVGFSLKLVKGTGTITEYNMTSAHDADIKLIRLEVSSNRNTVFTTKSCDVIYSLSGTQKKADMRTKSFADGFSFMTVEKNSFGGSIGRDAIFNIIGTAPSFSPVDINPGNTKFLAEMWRLYKNLDTKYKQAEFIDNCKKATLDWLMSKYYGMLVLNALKGPNGLHLFKELYFATTSQSEYSSAFMKIE